MESEKLLPCPFCGRPAEMTSRGMSWRGDVIEYAVECAEKSLHCPASRLAMFHAKKDWAITAWNTRAPADLRSALEAETIERCNMGVGCEQYGVCYAEANGQPGQCPKNALSIDEAVSRIPDEAFWQLGHDGEGADPSQFKARVFNPMTMARPAEGWGDTPADAIRAALAPTKGDVL